jgi:hypothetical protein
LIKGAVFKDLDSQLNLLFTNLVLFLLQLRRNKRENLSKAFQKQAHRPAAVLST